MADVILKNLNKIYDNKVQAVFDFNLEIKDGEFIVLVGPSGCGKSTTLRMVAGLEEITSGDLIIDGKRVNNLASKDRDIAMVFQNYALYSHMSVYHNMAFSLVIRKTKSDIIHKKVMQAAEILELTSQLNKKPRQLSGGQRQRVALGRSIVRDPKLFLLDEPLSNLDAKLRGSMRRELALLHDRLKATMIYVTHDQVEALTLADRIVVMNDGYVQQIGTPKELYEDPANVFVASFIGTPPMNILNMLITEDGCANFIGTNIKYTLRESTFNGLKSAGYAGKEVILGIRPESVILAGSNPDRFLDYKADIIENLGANTLVHGYVDNIKLIMKVPEWLQKVSDNFQIQFEEGQAVFFDKETKFRIRWEKK